MRESVETDTKLSEVLEELQQRFPKLSLDDRFILWFFLAWVFGTDSENYAAEAVLGGTRDNGIDGLVVEDAPKIVTVVQGKYHKVFNRISEKRPDVLALVEVAHRLCESDDKKFAKYLAKTDGLVAERLRDARKRILAGYKLWLYFASTGKITRQYPRRCGVGV